MEHTRAGVPDAVDLVGKRVQIRAIKNEGSARVLNGLTGIVTATHPIATGWCLIDLDMNHRTVHRSWSIAVDRLVVIQ
jgi:hypothetical protein